MLLSRLANREDGRVGELALGGYRVIANAQLVCCADTLDAVLRHDLVGNDRRGGKNSSPPLAKGFHQGRVVKLPNDARGDVVAT